MVEKNHYLATLNFEKKNILGKKIYILAKKILRTQFLIDFPKIDLKMFGRAKYIEKKKKKLYHFGAGSKNDLFITILKKIKGFRPFNPPLSPKF